MLYTYRHFLPLNCLTNLSFLRVLCLKKALKYDLFQKIFFEYFPQILSEFKYFFIGASAKKISHCLPLSAKIHWQK